MVGGHMAIKTNRELAKAVNGAIADQSAFLKQLNMPVKML